MVRTLEELMTEVKGFMPEETTDEVVAMLEDLTDTVTDLSNRVTEAGDWKTKFEENDAAWKKRYTDRFFEGVPDPEEKREEVETKTYIYEDLFKED